MGLPRSIGTATAIKTITNMVLISIHPFALRRLFLVVLAVAGFSALCFADPVLMAQRYGSEKPRAAASNATRTSISGRFLNFESANLRSSIGADGALSLEEAAIPTNLFTPVVSWNSHREGPIEAFYGTASNPTFLTAITTD